MANLTTARVEYEVDGVVFEGYVACDSTKAARGPLPVVMVCHAFYGRTDFECCKADDLAKLGYVGFAVDLYGKGVVGTTVEENMKLMKPLLDDRKTLIGRLRKSLDAVKALPYADSKKISAIGYCFGGLCVLDLARNGLGLAGCVSIHGTFKQPDYPTKDTIETKILVLHGDADFHIPPEMIRDLEKEMRDKKADWQLHVYGNAYHAFTFPSANDMTRGVKYDPKADRRSWTSTVNFLEECFE